MFDNIGGKIKGLATFICWFGIIVSVIAGIAMISSATQGRYTDETLVWTGIAVAVLGSLLSWVGSFVLYGFGELVENSSVIAKNTEVKQANMDSSKEGSSKVVSSGKYWTCPTCKKQNPLTTSYCLCGTPKPEQRRVDWTCKYCGTTNKYYEETCTNCLRAKED